VANETQTRHKDSTSKEAQSALEHRWIPHEKGNPLRQNSCPGGIVELNPSAAYNDCTAQMAHKTVRLCISISTSSCRQILYIYMKIPKGLELDQGDPTDCVLQLHKNVYGQKQAGRVWNKYLVNKLVKELKFVQSKTDECVFYRGSTMHVLCTDDSILAGPDKAKIN
jgi:hypothetical protein